MKVLAFRWEAREELLEAVVWYETERAGLGSRFEKQVDRVFSRIEKTPKQFPEVEPGYRRALVHGFPYGIFFTEDDDEIIVLAVMNLYRDPERWKSRR